MSNANENAGNTTTDKKLSISKKGKKQEEIYISFEDKTYFDKIKQIEEKLKNYIIENYDVDNEKISLKFIHTFNVKLANDQIVESLNLSDRDKYLATIIALFHDYARFEQIRLYDSFNDLLTVDHGNLAVEMLFDKKQINNFVSDLTQEELKIAYLAIKNHNKYAIEDGLSDRQMLFCKIIRDADKVDIYRVISSNFRADYLNKGTLEKSDLDNFYKNQLRKNSKEQTFYTRVITSLSFIYDIYFKKSYEIIYKNKYINKYMCALLLATPFKVEEELLDCFKYAENFVKEQVSSLKN